MPLAQIAPILNEALSTASQIEKLTVIGVIALWALLSTWAAWKLQRKLVLLYRSRDKERAIRLVYKAALDGAGLKVDISEILQQYKDDIVEEGVG